MFSRFSGFLFFALLSAAILLGQGLNGLTFFMPSDTHYGRQAWEDNEAVNKSAIDDMNALPGTEFPVSEDGQVDYPEGVLIPGDLTGAHWVNWHGIYPIMDGFATDYGVAGEGRCAYPVYEGYGNHDLSNGWLKGWPIIDGIKNRNLNRATSVEIDETGLHYSWDWEGVHFINLNLYAGGEGKARNSLDFLKRDLVENVAKGQPIIIYQHYDLKAQERWWTAEEKETFYQVIKDFNVIGIFVGHSHRAQHYKWKGFDIFNAPAVKNEGEYLVVKIEDGKLVVYIRSPKGWGKRWEKNFEMEKGE